VDRGVLQKVKICVLGADGQLGQEFRFLAPSYEFLSFSFFGRSTLDITDEAQLNAVFRSVDYDYVINCAAYTAVDKAESESDVCFAINTTACSNIVQALAGLNTRLIHFSSDYVYHTYNGFPLHENDMVSPKGVYARSKWEGEEIIRQSNVPALILRTSWVISSFGHNFVKTMLRMGAEKSSLSVVNDQYGAPTYARHLAQAVLDIITSVVSDEALQNKFCGTYNYANEGVVTWYDIANTIMKIAELSCDVKPIPTDDYPTPARRPRWSVMSKNKIKTTFSLEIPHWYSALKECVEAIQLQPK
jgi:dTDP-4-dehydrorhamnose reductase